MVLTQPTGAKNVEDLGAPEKVLESLAFLFGKQTFAGKTLSEGGFAPDRVGAASLLEVKTIKDKKGKSYYRYEVLTRTADGDEGGRHQVRGRRRRRRREDETRARAFFLFFFHRRSFFKALDRLLTPSSSSSPPAIHNNTNNPNKKRSSPRAWPAASSGSSRCRSATSGGSRAWTRRPWARRTRSRWRKANEKRELFFFSCS
jgi:hypothetical protein